MRDWFLLDRINVSSNHFSIDQEMEFAPDILPDTAQPNLSVGNVTVASTRCATDPPVREWLVQLRFLDHFRLVCWAEHNFSNTTAHAILGQSA